MPGYPGYGHWACWTFEGVWGGGGGGTAAKGTYAVPKAMVAAEIVPFDPCETIEFNRLANKQEVLRNLRQLGPAHVLTSELQPTDVSLDTYYRTPFLLCCLFTHKAVGAWAPYTVAADFSDMDDVNTIALHFARDASGTYGEDLLGGIVTDAEISTKMGEPVKAKYGLRFFRKITNTATYATLSASSTILDSFGWCDWNSVYHDSYDTTNTTWTWNSLQINHTNYKAEVQEGSFKITREVGTSRNLSTLEHTAAHVSQIDYEVKLKLQVTGDFSAAGFQYEADLPYVSKTKASLVFAFGSASKAETLTLTNAYVDSVEGYAAPGRDAYWEVTVTFKGGDSSAASYAGTFSVSEEDPTPASTASVVYIDDGLY
jgi:hypothetical protein